MHLTAHEPVTATLLAAWGRPSREVSEPGPTLAIPPRPTSCHVQAGKWYQEGGMPLPTRSGLAKDYLRSRTFQTLIPPHEDPLRSSPQKGQNNCSLTSTILTAMLGWPALDGIPKAPSQPRPLWKGPRLWNSLPGSNRKNGGQPDKRERSKNGERRLPNRTSACGGWAGLRKLRTQCTQFMDDNAGHRAQGYFWRYWTLWESAESYGCHHQKNAHLHIIARGPLMSLGQCFPNLLNDKNHPDADLQFTVPNSLPKVLCQQVRGRGSFFVFVF